HTTIVPSAGLSLYCFPSLFSFTAPAPTEIYTLSLHDALPICMPPSTHRTEPPGRAGAGPGGVTSRVGTTRPFRALSARNAVRRRSEEHTSELQSRSDLVCRLLLEKKKKKVTKIILIRIITTTS